MQFNSRNPKTKRCPYFAIRPWPCFCFPGGPAVPGECRGFVFAPTSAGMGLTYRVPGVRGHLARILPANRSPQDGGLTQAWLDRKSKSPLFPGPGEGGHGYNWLVHNPSMDFKFDLFTEEENHFPTYLFFLKHVSFTNLFLCHSVYDLPSNTSPC